MFDRYYETYIKLGHSPEMASYLASRMTNLMKMRDEVRVQFLGCSVIAIFALIMTRC